MNGEQGVKAAKILMVTGGNAPLKVPVGPWDTVIAVDSGGDTLEHLGISAHLIIGDLDSISPRGLAFHQDSGALVKRFPQDKDFTDFELALQELPKNAKNQVFVAGLFGGRFDHALMNLLVLSRYTDRGLFCFDIDDGTGGILSPGTLNMTIAPGSPHPAVALMALSPHCRGIHSTGVRWPLENGTLAFGESRGISNSVVASSWRLTLTEGALCWLILGKDHEAVEIEWRPRPA
jgi:thiamine pyrophosphokinase